MNTYTYKNRGMFLEKLLNDTNTYYLFKDIAVIYKKPTPIKVLVVKYPSLKNAIIDKAVFERTSTLDYNGIYKGKYIEFDAKESKNTTSFPLSNIKAHQIEHIKNIIKHKGIVFLIIYIKHKFFIFKGETLIDFMNNNKRKSIGIDYIETNGYEIKEGLNPSLDYLKIIDKIYLEEKNG